MSSLATYLRTTPLGELLTGTAHEAHPTDLTAPLGVRFAGRTLLVVHLALDRAATVRVGFERDGRPRLSGICHVKQRTAPEFGEVLRSEAAATAATWACVVFATGWQAQLGQRSARTDPTDKGAGFARHHLMFESPEAVLPRADIDRVYTAVDHPVLDKSIVFSLRRREIDEVAAELRKCGLGVASVRIAVAAQLESWLAARGEAALATDLLLTDGLGALLLNVQHGDFVPPPSAVDADQPRQSVQRPSAVEDDIARFVAANGQRALTFIGPAELGEALRKRAPQVEVSRPADVAAHDVQSAVLAPEVRHDLNYEARAVRPALPHKWRRVVIGYAVALGLFGAIALVNGVYAVRIGYDAFRLERDSARRLTEASADDAAVANIARELGEASAVRTWVAGNFHAQELCYQLLKAVPAPAALDRLLVELRDGQLLVSFVVLGDDDAQLTTHRAIERAITQLKYKIGGEDMPAAAVGPNHAVQYRLHLIVPDAGEAA